MTQIEILTLAREALFRRYDMATSMIRAKPSDLTKNYRNSIVEQTMEINRMINAEHERLLKEAEVEHQQEEPKSHCYETVFEYTGGKTTHTKHINKEAATRYYNKAKDLMPEFPIVNRISLTEDGTTIRSCERGDF